TTGLPADVLGQAAGRLRAMALLYAFVFFMAGFFPALLFPDDRHRLFTTPTYWIPGATAIAVALAVAAAARSRRVPLPAVMTMALVFEVISNYLIAMAEFLDPNALTYRIGFIGLSWVAVWTLLFTVVVPTPPRRAVVAAIASVSGVPVVIGLT